MTINNYTYYSVKHFGNRKEIPVYEDENGFCTICGQNHSLNRLSTGRSIFDALSGIFSTTSTAHARGELKWK